MKGPVHVTVQMATVGLPVQVSVLHGLAQLMQVVHFCSRCDLVREIEVPTIIPPVTYTRNFLHGYILLGNNESA